MRTRYDGTSTHLGTIARISLVVLLLWPVNLTAGDRDPVSLLRACLIPPGALRPACSLIWQIEPRVVSAADPEEAKELALWSSFWFGGPARKELIRAASSTIYSTAAQSNACTVHAFYWTDVEHAAKALAFLKAHFQGSTKHVFQLHGPILVAFTNMARLPEDCFETIQRSVSQAYEHALQSPSA